MTIIHTPAITYPTILIAVFARQLCLPIPAVLFLITAGALAAGGSLNLLTVILAGVVGCLLADYAWFIAGRWWGHRIVRALCTFSMNGQNYARRARRLFASWGSPSLMFAKFVPGLDGLMPPLAGMLNVTSIRFLLFDAAGAFFWSAGYCFVGYVFAGHLDIVTATLGRVSGILAIVLAGVLCYLMWRAWELLHTMSQLRRITPAQLQEKLGTGKKVMVLDLLNIEGQEDANNCPRIPGAVRIPPSRLRSSTKVRVPPDV
jgi:membrane protein DedA with SNARE-associated domain